MIKPERDATPIPQDDNLGPFESLWRASKVKNETHQKNLDTFKLLITYKKFQEAIMQECEKIRMHKIRLENGEIDILNYGILLSESTIPILKRFNLPFNFRPILSSYLQTGEFEINKVPNRNYDFRFNPISIIGTNGKILEPVLIIQLLTYTALTEKEMKEAMKELKQFQKSAFPNSKLFSRFNKHKNLDRQLDIEKKGSERNRPRVRQSYKKGSYLDMVKDTVSPEKFKEIRKFNLRDVEKKQEGYTSKDIGKDINTTPDQVRKVIERLDKERKEKFEPKRDKN